MSNEQWDGPIIELSRDMTAWLVWLMSRDLENWQPDRRTRLDREEAASLALFLCDHLPPDLKTEVKAAPPALKVG